MPDGLYLAQVRCYWPNPSRLLLNGAQDVQ
jgi:hypothetical protein